MPKEYTHWSIAQKILEAPELPSIPGPVLDALRCCPHSFLLGSVTSDTPFYYLFGKHKQTFREIALQTHGEGEYDSFESLKTILKLPGSNLTAPLLSLFLGTLCHVITDAVFHPIVQGLTGSLEEETRKGEDPEAARRKIIEKHYLVETCLDIYVQQHSSLPEGGRYIDILTEAKREDPKLIEHLSLYFFRETKGHENMIHQAINLHARIQRGFHSSSLSTLITLISPLFPSLQPFRTIFYPKCRGNHYSAFDSTIPDSQESRHPPFAELADKTLIHCRNIFTHINSILKDTSKTPKKEEKWKPFFQKPGPKANGKNFDEVLRYEPEVR